MATPEGVYHISGFNPKSKYHLSLKINYPNAADRIRAQIAGVKGSLGGDIFIHGDCVTAGCIALTDPIIEYVYWLADHAINRSSIPVVIFPHRDIKVCGDLAYIIEDSLDDPDVDPARQRELAGFYRNLRDVYLAWQTTGVIPTEDVDGQGLYIVR